MNSLNKQRIFRGLAAIGILILIVIPGEIIGLLFELLHIIWELTLEFAHILFEWAEVSLDTLIELLFETDLHDTQIIVFYIIMSAISYAAYRLLRLLPAAYRRLKHNLLTRWMLQKTRLLQWWYSLSLPDKIKWVAMAIGVCYVVFFLSF
jgi:hypothetical protein